MTDTYETPCNGLSGDDWMAFNFLNRAANALVSASDLSKQLAQVSQDLAHISEARATLEEIKRAQEDRIASLEAQLSNALDAEATANRLLNAAEDRADARQRDVDLLDDTVAQLRSKLSATEVERDEYGLKHIEACDERDDARAKLREITDTMKRIGFNFAVPEPAAKPEPDHRDYAEMDPGYRSQVTGYHVPGEPNMPEPEQYEAAPRFDSLTEGAETGKPFEYTGD